MSGVGASAVGVSEDAVSSASGAGVSGAGKKSVMVQSSRHGEGTDQICRNGVCRTARRAKIFADAKIERTTAGSASGATAPSDVMGFTPMT